MLRPVALDVLPVVVGGAVGRDREGGRNRIIGIVPGREFQMGKEFLAGSLRPCLQAKAYLTEIRGLRR